jgi:PGF-CTERM protein
MPPTTARLRSGFLTALVIGSIITACVAFSGGAAAVTNEELSVDRTTVGTESTTATINASANLGATGTATVVNVTNSDFVLDGVSAGDVTVGNSSTRIGAESVDTGDDFLNITLGSELGIGSGETVYVEIDTVENPPVDTAGLPDDLTRGVTVRFADSGDTVIDEAFEADFQFTLESGRFDWNRDTGSGNVTDGATLYQGEGDITIYAPDGEVVSPSSLQRTGGASEGEPLALPIPEDQPTGPYSDGSGTEVTVQTARITTFDVTNNNDAAVNGGTLMPGQDRSEVEVAYNFGEAERLELIIEDETGLDVTNEFLASGEDRYLATDDGEGAIGIDPGNVDMGEYTFTVEGADDLDFGAATQSTTIDVSTTTGDGSSGGGETGDGTDGDGGDPDDDEPSTDGEDGTDDGDTTDGGATDGGEDGTDDGGDPDDEEPGTDGEDGTDDGDTTDGGATDGTETDGDDGTADGGAPEDQPGFGAILAVAALLGAGLIAAYRNDDPRS